LGGRISAVTIEKPLAGFFHLVGEAKGLAETFGRYARRTVCPCATRPGTSQVMIQRSGSVGSGLAVKCAALALRRRVFLARSRLKTSILRA
jgi:hypothetical protein